MSLDAAVDTRLPGKHPGDHCSADPLYDRRAETLSPEDLHASANGKWARQVAGLVDRSPFYQRFYKGSGIALQDARTVDDLKNLPLTSKDDLRAAQEAYPPFGDYLGVDPSSIFRIYQTSGTSGAPCLLVLTRHDLREVWGKIQSRSYYAA